MKQTYPTITLSEVVDTYCASAFNTERKHYENYLVHGRAVWRELLKNTPFSIRHRLFKIDKTTTPWSVMLPYDLWRLMGVSAKSPCGSFLNITEDPGMAIYSGPSLEDAGCGCDCGCATGICGAEFAATTKDELIDGISFQAITWVKKSKNGDLTEIRRFPVKKFTSLVDYTVEWREEESFLCSLDVKPCGCVKDTIDNRHRLIHHGCQPLHRPSAEKCCGPAHYKVQGRRLYLKNVGALTHIILSWQSNGECAGEEILVPEFCSEAIQFGITYRAAALSPGSGRLNIRELRREYKVREDELHEFLNPLRIDDFLSLQGIFEWGGFGKGCLVSFPCQPESAVDIQALLDEAMLKDCGTVAEMPIPEPTSLPPGATPDDLEYIIGRTVGGPQEGATTFRLPVSVAGYPIRLYRTGDKQSVRSGDYTYDLTSRNLTVVNGWQKGELIQIELAEKADMELIVGQDGPDDGVFFYQNDELKDKKVVLYRGRVRQSLEAVDFTHDRTSGSITVPVAFQGQAGQEEVIGFEFYSFSAPSYLIGVTTGAPTVGQNSFLLPDLNIKPRIRLYRDRIKQSILRGDFTYDRLTRQNRVHELWQDNELVQYEFFA